MNLRQNRHLIAFINGGLDPAAVEPMLLLRVRVLHLATPFVVLLGLPFMTYYGWMGRFDLAAALLITVIGSLATIGLVRGRPQPTAAGWVMVSLFYALLLFIATQSGGSAMPGFIWFGVLPLAAVLMIGPEAGWLWTGITILTTIVFHLLPSWGIVLPPLAVEHVAAINTISRICAILTVAVLASCFVVLRRQTVAALRDEVRVRESAERRALAASRAKSAFLANVSHEIRTPMNGVLGMSDLLLNSDLPDDQKRQIEIIRGSSESLLALVNDILDFSKIEAGRLDLHPEDFRLREQVNKIVQLLKPRAAAKGLRLTAEIEGRLPDGLHGDAQRLRQVLLNLVGNALKFTEKGSVRIEVRTGESEVPQGRLAVHFAVRDTGIGIPQDALRRIFGAFDQADTNVRFGGTGLGLSISKGLVELMKGSIGVASEVGKGSTFFFEIPLARARWKVRDEGPETDRVFVRPSPGTGEILVVRPASEVRILVVDDNEVNRFVAESHLESLGFTADTADSGAEALSAFQKERYDIVLMDCQMPGMDGYETTRRLRQEEPRDDHAVVIALTAAVMAGERDRCLEAGMDDYLAKPYRLEELSTTLARWLPDWRPGQPASRQTKPRGGRPPRLDHERLAMFRRLERETGKSIFGRLFQSFKKSAWDYVAKMRVAVAEGDAKALNMYAHSLAGSAGTQGTARVAHMAREIEQLAKKGDTAGCEARVGELARELELALDELDNLTAS